MTPKPINHVRIEPQRDLLFDWPKQRTTARSQSRCSGDVAGLDLILWKRGQSINLSALFGVRCSEIAFFISSRFVRCCLPRTDDPAHFFACICTSLDFPDQTNCLPTVSIGVRIMPRHREGIIKYELGRFKTDAVIEFVRTVLFFSPCPAASKLPNEAN